MLISKQNIILYKQHIVLYFSFSHLSEQTNYIQISDRIFVPYRLNVPVLIVHHQCIIFQRKKFFFIIFHQNLCVVDMHAIAFAFVHTKKTTCLHVKGKLHRWTGHYHATKPLHKQHSLTASSCSLKSATISRCCSPPLPVMKVTHYSHLRLSNAVLN